MALLSSLVSKLKLSSSTLSIIQQDLLHRAVSYQLLQSLLSLPFLLQGRHRALDTSLSSGDSHLSETILREIFVIVLPPTLKKNKTFFAPCPGTVGEALIEN